MSVYSLSSAIANNDLFRFDWVLKITPPHHNYAEPALMVSNLES